MKLKFNLEVHVDISFSSRKKSSHHVQSYLFYKRSCLILINVLRFGVLVLSQLSHLPSAIKSVSGGVSETRLSRYYIKQYFRLSNSTGTLGAWFHSCFSKQHSHFINKLFSSILINQKQRSCEDYCIAWHIPSIMVVKWGLQR